MMEVEFRRYCDLLDDELMLVDRGGQVRAANRALLRGLGYRETELEGRSLFDLSAQEPEEVRAYLRLCRRSRDLLPGALTLLSATGEPVRFRCDGGGVPATESEGTSVMLRLRPRDRSSERFLMLSERIDQLNREIASRRRAESQLARQREWLTVALRSIADGVLATDRDGRVNFLNPVAAELIGARPDEAHDARLDTLLRFVETRAKRSIHDRLAEVLNEGIELRASGTLLRGQEREHEIPVELSAAPLLNGGEKPSGLILVLRDVTNRRRIEAQRKDALARERQARRLAEVADSAKDEFLASLSHELRAPLNVLTTWIRLLNEQPTGDPQLRDGLRVIERNVQRQAMLVDELLDFSHLIAGEVKVTLKALPLNRLVEEVGEELRRAAEDRDIHLRLNLGKNVREVMADPLRLRQVLHQLLGNAIKFTPPNGEIVVRTAAQSKRATVQVSDSGAGVKAEVLPRIFDHFRQQDGSRSRRYGGLGLGLAIVRRLVELQQGTIEAKSPGPGRGTTFTLTLPRPDASSASPELEATGRPPASKNGG